MSGSGPREPGETNLQHSLQRFVWLAESEYIYPVTSSSGGAPTSGIPLVDRVSEALRLQVIDRIDRLYYLIQEPPRWADFTPLQRANISAQTGSWLRWFMSGPDYTQDQVLIEDPATVDQAGFCANPNDEDPSNLQLPCEVYYASDCFTITRPAARGIQAQNYSRLFGCPDYFYTLESAVAQVSESLAAVDAQLGLYQEGETSVAEVGEAVLDEVVTTKVAMQDTELTETPWAAFAIAGLLAFLVLRGIDG